MDERTGELDAGLDDVVLDKAKFTVVEGQHLTLLDGVAVVLGITRGKGDLSGGYPVKRLGHVQEVFLQCRICVKGKHCG